MSNDPKQIKLPYNNSNRFKTIKVNLFYLISPSYDCLNLNFHFIIRNFHNLLFHFLLNLKSTVLPLHNAGLNHQIYVSEKSDNIIYYPP